MLSDEQKILIAQAKRRLHDMPEPPGHEERTKAFIMDFLKEHTTLEVHDMDAWLYAKHDEGAAVTVAFRADFDAVCVGDRARHLCGHDGHTAALLGLALLLEGARVGKNVILLFQHAEETGEGAAECMRLFGIEKVDAVLGAHNIPKMPMGTVILKRGTFACASCGMEIRMTGKPTHAAYPENGINPAEALAKLTIAIPQIAEELSEKHSCMCLATVVGLNLGERAFGVAASEGSLLVTLRSEKTEAMEELTAQANALAERLADEFSLVMKNEFYDVFPATVNNDALLVAAEDVLKKESLPYLYIDEPFRWSEDFGHYGEAAPSLFFGIGSGEDTAPLHTEGYVYPLELALVTAERVEKLIEKLKLSK